MSTRRRAGGPSSAQKYLKGNMSLSLSKKHEVIIMTDILKAHEIGVNSENYNDVSKVITV